MKYRMPILTRARLKVDQLLWLPQEYIQVRLQLPAHVKRFCEQIDEVNGLDKVIDNSLQYIESNKLSAIGRYSYKPSGPPLLYASAYAALTLHLTGHIKEISDTECTSWIDYLNSFQGTDGLYRDPLINSELAEHADWWGWRHLSVHVASAVIMLGGLPQRPFHFLAYLNKANAVQEWLENQDWTDAAGVSNHVQNVGIMLQMNRDYFGYTWCDSALDELFIWLDEHQDTETGLWGNNLDTAEGLSNGVQAGYHFWLLYFYDRRIIKYREKIIDSCLKTQNPMGGFGVSLNSSACEDIDSIDPLVRLQFLTHYRKDDVRKALINCLPWLLSNQNHDGGWVFRRYQPFRYGHSLMRTGPQESSMFATWFRLLSVAYLQRVLPSNSKNTFTFSHVPGLQFWGE
jgi:hypothetical protein